MKTKNKMIAYILCLIGCVVFFVIYTESQSEGSPDWKATYKKHYIPDNGGYYVEFQKNVWTYTSGKKDSSLWVFIEPDTTVDVGHKRFSFQIIDFDINGQLDLMRVWERPEQAIPESEWGKIPQIWIKKKSGKWEYDGGNLSIKTLITELPILMSYYHKANTLN